MPLWWDPAPLKKNLLRGVLGSILGATAANAVYAANDPAPGLGSAMQFSHVPRASQSNTTGGIVVAAANGSSVPAYRKFHAANPSIVTFNGTAYLYFRADPGTNIQSIGLFTQALGPNFDPINGWTDQGVVIAPAATPAGFNGTWDPCVTVFNGKIYLFWQNGSTATTGCPTPNETFYASSTDGKTFSTPVDTGFAAGAGSVCVVGSTLYSWADSSTGVLQYRTTTDLVTWSVLSAAMISPTGKTYATTGTPYGDPDGAAADTARFFYQAPYLYCTYGGTPLGYSRSSQLDWPEGICLARSQAPFTSWEKFGANPILLRGPVSAFDAAAVWSGSYFRVNGVSYLFYEATGGSNLSSRDTPYTGFPTESATSGGSGGTCFSQVGVAIAPADATLSNWYPDTDDLPPGVYTIKNQLSGKYLGTVGPGGTTSGTKVAQFAVAQNWIVTRLPDGYYMLSLQAAGAAGAQELCNNSSARSSGVQLLIYSGPGSATTIPYVIHEFKLMPVSHSSPGVGVYEIINRYNGYNVEAQGSNTTEGGVIDCYPRVTSQYAAGQQWLFTKVG